MKTSVYLADLRHDYSGVLSMDCMPLGVAYMKAVMDRDLPEVHSRLFAYPNGLSQALRTNPPDVLMVGNYVWNEQLSLRYLRMAKELNPNILTVMGGPNIPLEADRQTAYLRNHPEIDVYVLGEGDFLAAEVVRQFIEAGKSLKAFRELTLPSSIFRRPDGEVTIQRMWDRRKEIDDLPSVWLTGILDEFFDGRLAPLLETNRGCPFTRTFCVQGINWYTKVHQFSTDRIKEEVEYIARRVQRVCPSVGLLRIADSNYGMFERDIEISGYIGDAQRKYGWPSLIDATTGKNRPERIIQSLEKVSGALVMYQAVQSLDELTLRNIKRSNIKLDAYEKIQIHVQGRGLRSVSDLILGLPGETLETHLNAIRKLVDAGTGELHNFQSMMLKGSEMETLDDRKRFAFDARFRVLPKNFGMYDDQKVFDIEEIVVATGTLPFDDYVEARKYHLGCTVFWNHGAFHDLVACGKRFDVKPSEWLDAVLAALREETGDLKRLLTHFVEETISELFPTREACVEFYSREENFQLLRLGEIGDNLVYRYRAMATFLLWPEVCRLAVNAMKDLIVARRPDCGHESILDLWPDLHRFVELTHAHGTSLETVLAPRREQLRYDVARWIEDGAPFDASPYRLDAPATFEFALSEDAAREISAAFKVWSTDLKGLAKLVTRVRPSSLMRQCQRVEASPRASTDAVMAGAPWQGSAARPVPGYTA